MKSGSIFPSIRRSPRRGAWSETIEAGRMAELCCASDHEQIANIGLYGYCDLHGSEDMELYLSLGRRGFGRGGTPATCVIPKGGTSSVWSQATSGSSACPRFTACQHQFVHRRCDGAPRGRTRDEVRGRQHMLVRFGAVSVPPGFCAFDLSATLRPDGASDWTASPSSSAWLMLSPFR